MKKSSDFTNASTITSVQKTLSVMDAELENKKEYKYVYSILILYLYTFVFCVSIINCVQTTETRDTEDS